MSRSIITAASLAFVVLASAAAQADSGGGGGNDRLSEASQAHQTRRDTASTSWQGTDTRSTAAGHGYRDVSTTRDGKTTTRRVGGRGEPTAAEWKDPNGNVVRWNPPRGRQPDFAETDYRGVKIRAEADGRGGRDVTTTRGGRSQTRPSRFDNQTWAEWKDAEGRTMRWEPGNRARRVEGGNK